MARPRSARRSVPAVGTDLPGRSRDALTSRLPGWRGVLEQQRRFRCEQLILLDANGRTQEYPARAGLTDGRDEEAAQAMREVDAVLADGARRALADIELALLRMDTGRYGYCRSCGTRIPLAVLEAIPETTQCLACQQDGEHSDDQHSPAASRSNRASAQREATHRRQRRRRRWAAGAGGGYPKPRSWTR